MVEHSHLEMCSLTSLLIRRTLPGSLPSAFLSREFAQIPSACIFALQLDLKSGPLRLPILWTQSSNLLISSMNGLLQTNTLLHWSLITCLQFGRIHLTLIITREHCHD